ncbi:hypothetical protein ACFCZ3_19700 [Cellulosimicrobium cellulans]|uniref:hypothetical protein n=1 Tax=Cellulosimicrobium cellulans TaxID=1710 RepID=UPI0035E3B977
MTDPTPGIPATIDVVRDRDGFLELVVDGRPFPYAIAAFPEPKIALTPGAPSGITVTLVCGTLRVVDKAGHQVLEQHAEHAHAAEQLREVTPADLDAIDPADDRPVPLPPARAATPAQGKEKPEPKPCSASCALVRLKPGQYVCDEDQDACHRRPDAEQ